jgi:Aerotolerance regulator N-terminal
MQFLNPIWLWGLTGLLIPIAIHMLSRKEGKVIRVGSIRHLEETSTRQFKKIKLNEVVLLAMRCLLITLIVLLLSGLSFNRYNTNDINYLLLEKGMENESDFKPLVDSLKEKGYEVRWLTNGFPLLEDSAVTDSNTNYWSLIESLKKEQVQQTVVLSYNYANGFKGKRTELPTNVHWISKQPAPLEFTLTSTRLSPDSVLVRKGNTSAEGTHFANYQVRGESLTEEEKGLLQNQDTISIAVYSDAKFEYDKEIVMAALNAVDETLPCVLNVKSSEATEWKDEKSDWIIWLSEKTIPEIGITKSIQYSKNEFGNELFTLSRKGWLLTKRLDQEIAIDENLAVQLASILLPDDEAQQRANELDRRASPEKQLWSSASLQEGNTLVLAGTTSAMPYLAGLILLVLLTERIIAFKRNQ